MCSSVHHSVPGAMMDDPLVDEFIKLVKKCEQYEEALRTIYNNIGRSTDDLFMRHCIMRKIEEVMPKITETVET